MKLSGLRLVMTLAKTIQKKGVHWTPLKITEV